jgi:hypothetical protein
MSITGHAPKLSLTLTPVAYALTSPANYLNFQGELFTSTGAPVTGAQSFNFSIYSSLTSTATSAQVYCETQTLTLDSDGVFYAEIGAGAVCTGTSWSGLTWPPSFSVPYYLQVTVGSDVLSPRIALTSAPYGTFTGLSSVPPLGGYSYLVNTTTISGTKYYYAYDADGRLAYGGPGNAGSATGTSLPSVWNKFIGSNEKIVFAAGSYVIASQLASSANNIVVQGAGSATNLTVPSSSGFAVVSITGNNWLITQLRFDSRNMAAPGGNYVLYLNGVNDTVSSCYFYGGNQAIYLVGKGDQALYNTVVSAYSDGIVLHGVQQTVVGNHVYGTTTSNTISAVGVTGAQILDNTAVHSGSTGIALENNAGSGPGTGVVISGNVIVSPAVNGIDTSSTGSAEAMDNVTISNNYIYSSPAAGILLAGRIMGATISDNVVLKSTTAGIDVSVNSGASAIQHITIVGNTVTNAGTFGIVVANPASHVTIQDNVLNAIVAEGIMLEGVSYCSVMGNSVTMTSTSTGAAVETNTNPVTGCTIAGNVLYGPSKTSGWGMYFVSALTNTTVSNNVVVNFQYGIKEYSSSGSNNNVYTGNQLGSIGTVASYGGRLILVGGNDTVSGNMGVDPPNGRITYAWGPHTVGFMGGVSTQLCSHGGSNCPAASGTTYAITGMTIAFSCSGGGTVTIAEKNYAGTTIASALTCTSVAGLWFPPGYRVTITNSSDFTSFYVFGD